MFLSNKYVSRLFNAKIKGSERTFILGKGILFLKLYIIEMSQMIGQGPSKFDTTLGHSRNHVIAVKVFLFQSVFMLNVSVNDMVMSILAVFRGLSYIKPYYGGKNIDGTTNAFCDIIPMISYPFR